MKKLISGNNFKEKPLNVAQIGCGYWGPNLARSFQRNPECHLIAIAETSEERRRFIKDNYPKVLVTSNYQSLIEDPKIDAIVIATPAHSHYKLTKMCLENKKHVLVEKPLAQSLKDAQELAALAEKNHCTLMVGHTYLYNDSIIDLQKRLVDLEDIYYFYSQRLNLGIVRNDVNVWWNLAPHDISILLYLNQHKMPKKINLKGFCYLQKDVEDVVFSVIQWNDSLSAHLHLSWLDPNKTRKLTVVGKKKMIIHDDLSSEKITVYDKGIDPLEKRNDYDQQTQNFFYRYGDIRKPAIQMQEPLKKEVDHFIQCVKTKKEPISGPNHAVAVVAILEAGQKSLDAGGKDIQIDNIFENSYECSSL